MSNDSVTFGLPVLGVVAGLAVLLYAEYSHMGDAVVYGGGVVILLCVGLMTAAIARA